MPRDLATVDSVVSALYEARSQRMGGSPDWARFRSLFALGARLVQTDSDRGNYYVWGCVDDYVAEHDDARHPMLEFVQEEIARRTSSFGAIAHVFSSYEQHYANTLGTGTSRGVNSFHLSLSPAGWRIEGWAWGEESDTHRIPADLLR